MMQRVTALVVCMALGAHGQKNVVQQPMSRPIPGQYLATASGVPCDKLKADIMALKAQFGGPLARPTPPGTAAVVDLCYVSFTGSQVLQEEVKKLDGVLYVEQEWTFDEAQTWGLDRIDQPDLPLDLLPFMPQYRGKGVKLYVMDGGILDTHEDFGGRVTSVDFSGEGSHDRNGHGTHCAATAAGTTFGVADEADIVNMKVFRASGGDWLMLLQAVEWVINNANETGVVSASLGGPYHYGPNLAFKKLAEADHIVVVAAGNQNRDACETTPAGVGGNGRNGGVITVGASSLQDERPLFSNYGPCVDLYAPGVDTLSAYTGEPLNQNTFVMSGTSMAAPHVAGVAAVLLEKHGMNKTAAIEELFDLAVPDKISGLPTHVEENNFLLQAPIGTKVPTSDIITNAPTARPSASPTEPTLPPTSYPTSEWTCPESWKIPGNGCDCECGGGDPDCDLPVAILWCNGEWTQNNRCDRETDTCVPVDWTKEQWLELGVDLDNQVPDYTGREPRATGPNAPSSSFSVVGVAAGALVLVALVAFVAIKKRISKPQERESSLSVVGAPPQFDV